ncbi:MAG: hypothetical protein H8E20_00180, partial [Verrucomicrobia bacterium]|nr:hypothetical protein [Verrucomicrobiota bacterium]
MHPFKLVAVLSFLLATDHDPTWAAERRPNIVLVLTDYQGFGAVLSHGDHLIFPSLHDRTAAALA